MGEIIFFLTLRSPDRVSYQRIFFCSNKGLPLFSRICSIRNSLQKRNSQYTMHRKERKLFFQETQRTQSTEGDCFRNERGRCQRHRQD